MPRVVYCDHSSKSTAENFRIVLESRGNQAIHINNENPVQAYTDIIAFRPDKIVIDLYFEEKDEGKDFHDWWGWNIIGQLKRGNIQDNIDIWVLSKYLRNEIKRSLETDFGISEDHQIKSMTITWKQLAERIGA